jgi:hypothetical protein
MFSGKGARGWDGDEMRNWVMEGDGVYEVWTGKVEDAGPEDDGAGKGLLDRAV